MIYCRVSTVEQTQNLSLPTQEARCREYCERAGLTVARVFVDAGESAKTANRPQLQKMLSYCREQKCSIRAVVVYQLNRFSRDSRDHHVLRGLLLGLGISVRSVTEPIDDTSTGKLMESMFAALAQWDNDVRGERTKAGMSEAGRRGRFPFRPLGYRNGSRALGEPSLVPDADLGPLVTRAFEHYASTKSLKSDILRTFAALGLKGRNGRAITPQTLDRMFRNPIYVGRVVVKGWKLDVRGDFVPLVSADVFRQVQLKLSSSSQAEPRKTLRNDFPLRRFVRCATCDTKLTGELVNGSCGPALRLLSLPAVRPGKGH